VESIKGVYCTALSYIT